MKEPTLVADVDRFVPDLDAAAQQLRDDPERVLAHVVPRPGRSPAERLEGAVSGDPQEELSPELVNPTQPALDRVLAGALSGIEKMRRDGVDADLAADERTGLEAVIVLVGRPAILVQDGKFLPPPEPWQKLEQKRADIEATLARVGRIELDGHPRFDWVGTGFLAGENVVLTNRHVVKMFASRLGSDWVLDEGVTARIDFAEELGSVVRRNFPITEIIGVHGEVDLAVLRVDGPGLAPLAVDDDPTLVGPDREVYVVGYPTADTFAVPEVVRKIFVDIYGVKRLQPGAVMSALEGKVFRHDCSTLGGNSGSCVLDLETNRVVGVHYRGRFREANTAVALAPLADDPLVKPNVPFV